MRKKYPLKIISLFLKYFRKQIHLISVLFLFYISSSCTTGIEATKIFGEVREGGSGKANVQINSGNTSTTSSSTGEYTLEGGIGDRNTSVKVWFTTASKTNIVTITGFKEQDNILIPETLDSSTSGASITDAGLVVDL